MVVNPSFALIAGVMVLSEVECLMIMFGLGASTCATRFEVDVSRFNEVTTSTVPAGHHGFRKQARDWDRVQICQFAAPLKAGAVNPEAVEQNRDLASYRHFCLFHTYPL
uniref:Uncharacterized protein n=1 Tax=Rhizobium loti TaxID=381 RepID=Q8KGQ8_RHILI|nr:HYPOTHETICAL PROTEIN [Mesorhizobium japonicum R7A]